MFPEFIGLQVFIKSLVLGFLSSIPLGPIGIICIQRTLGKNRWSGFVSGLGASTADTLLAIIAGMGLSFVLSFIKDYQLLFKLFGGIIVIIIGIKIFFKSPIRQFRERRLGKNTMLRDYISTLIITLSNPVAVFLFLAAFAGLNLLNNNYILHTLVFVGIFTGASIWWFILSSVVNVYREKFRLKNLWWLNKITGVIIILFGIAALVSILFS